VALANVREPDAPGAMGDSGDTNAEEDDPAVWDEEHVRKLQRYLAPSKSSTWPNMPNMPIRRAGPDGQSGNGISA